MKRSFMPNFIHSLDAANVHLLLDNISKINVPIYTIHDCFATTPNNMFTLETLVKKAFIDIYFKDEGYLFKIHKYFVENIISATDFYFEDVEDACTEYNNPYENKNYIAFENIAQKPHPVTSNSAPQREGYKTEPTKTNYTSRDQENINLKILNDTTIKVINRKTKEIIEIPNLPVGYFEKNKKINDFIKGLLNSKYFIG
jgi:DNA-dependent RNA polymerase